MAIVQIPDLTELTGELQGVIPTNPDVNLASLQAALDSGGCGASEALEEVKGLANDIKGLLAEGKDALGDLESLAGELQTAVNDGLAEVQDAANEAISSIQDEIAELQTKFGEEFAAAKEELREKWGDAVDDIDELLDGIPSLTDLLSGDGVAVDLCADVPDLKKEVQQIRNEVTGEVETVIRDIQNAPAAVTPSGAAADIEEAVTQMNQAFANISTGNSRSGKSFISVSIAYGRMEFGVAQRMSPFTTPARAELDELRSAWRGTDTWRAIQRLSREASMTPDELRNNDLLSADQEALLEQRDEYVRRLQNYESFIAEFNDLVKVHRRLIAGTVTQAAFDQAYDGLKSRWQEPPNPNIPDTAWTALENVFAYQEEKRMEITDFAIYQNI